MKFTSIFFKTSESIFTIYRKDSNKRAKSQISMSECRAKACSLYTETNTKYSKECGCYTASCLPERTNPALIGFVLMRPAIEKLDKEIFLHL